MVLEAASGHAPDEYKSLENRERKLKGKRAVVIGDSWGVNGVNAEITIALAKERVEIIGIVNSKTEKQKATKVAMDIEYRGDSIVDVVLANVTSPEDRERLQKEVGEKDILIINPSGTNEEARSEEINAWVDILPKMAKGGTVFLIAEDNKGEQLLKSRIPEIEEKSISFSVVNPQDGEDSFSIGQKVVELIRRGNRLQGDKSH